MKSFNNVIKEYDDFVSLGGANDDQIRLVEEVLGTRFSTEYKEFLVEYGSASVNGHEFLGICDSKRLNIETATLNARKKNPSGTEDLYLIENTGIDKILIWQSTDGRLFKTIDDGSPELLKTNLCEYVENN